MRPHARRLAALGAALGLVLAIALSPSAIAAPLSVPRASSVATADGPDFTPSKNKWREWMINLTSSVLGGATPDKWRAEQLANQHKYNHSWEQFNAQLGIDGVRVNDAGDVVGFKYSNRGQGTYDDVVIAGLEDQFKAKGATGGTDGRPMKAPATKTQNLTRGLLGAASLLSAFPIGTALGSFGVNAVGGLFGFDAQGAVCANVGDDLGGVALQILSGQNCDMWGFPAGFTENGDAGVTYGPLLVQGVGLQYVRTQQSNTGVRGYCFSLIGGTNGRVTLPAGYRFGYDNTSGGTSIKGNFATQSSATAQWCPGEHLYAYENVMADPGKAWIINDATGEKTTAGTTKDDPQRQMECGVTTEGGQTYRQMGGVYRDSQGKAGSWECPNLGGDFGTDAPSSVKVTEHTKNPDGTTSTSTAFDQQTTDGYKDWFEKYPECRTGACKLDLYVKPATGAPASCFDLEDGCKGWHSAPNKADLYECRYGVHVVPLDECNVYAGLFEPGRIDAGAGYSDPSTGAWSGGQTTVKPGQKVMNTPLQDPEAMRSCDLSGLGFDPIGWVLRPIQCAFEWAFVPRPSVVEVAMGGAGEQWANKPPAVVASTMQSLSLAPTAQGCKQTVTIFAGEFESTLTPVDNCAGSWMEPVTVISKVVTSAAMIFLVLIVLRRQVSGMIGYQQGQS
jgi:hypothetical protein